MDISVTLAKFVLNLLKPKDMIAFGVECLTSNYDTPSLRILAGLNENDSDQVVDRFQQGVGEMGQRFPEKESAGILIAKDYSKKILTGELTPYEGAKKIWKELYCTLNEPKWLEYFAGAASEIEDMPGRYKNDSGMCRKLIGEYESEIVKYAREISGSSSRVKE